MRLISEKDLAYLLRHLTPAQTQQLLHDLSQGLGVFSAEYSSASTSRKTIHQPLRTSLVTENGDTSLFMPVSDTATTGIKIVTVPAKGRIQGVINVLSPAGRLLGVLSAAEVTAFRTALATMTLLTRCTSIPKRQLVIFGAGPQAEWHARLALLLFHESVAAITFVNRGQGRLDALCQETFPQLREKYPQVTFSAYSKESLQMNSGESYETKLQADLAASDVIFCCTPSTEPIFPYAYLQRAPKQRFISLIGSYKPHMREIDSDTLLSGEDGRRIYVDSKEACLEESGELIAAKVTADQLVEIGELFAPNEPFKDVIPPPGANVVFKCVGMGIMDLIVAKRILALADELGIGVDADF